MNAWDPNRKVDNSKYSSTDLPTYPTRTLVGHVAMKGAQVGSVVGLFVGVPLASYLRKLSISRAWVRVMPIAPILGSISTLTLLFAKNYSAPMNEDAIDDRAFRIMQNKGQVKVDKYSVVGAAVGVAFGTVIAPGFGTVLAASSTGLATGTLYYAAEKYDVWSQLNKLVKPDENKKDN